MLIKLKDSIQKIFLLLLFGLVCVEQTYDEWSGKYEEDMQRIGYPGPANAARLLRSDIF